MGREEEGHGNDDQEDEGDYHRGLDGPVVSLLQGGVIGADARSVPVSFRDNMGCAFDIGRLDLRVMGRFLRDRRVFLFSVRRPDLVDIIPGGRLTLGFDGLHLSSDRKVKVIRSEVSPDRGNDCTNADTGKVSGQPER
jgi:hypothetical protein